MRPPVGCLASLSAEWAAKYICNEKPSAYTPSLSGPFLLASFTVLTAKLADGTFPPLKSLLCTQSQLSQHAASHTGLPWGRINRSCPHTLLGAHRDAHRDESMAVSGLKQSQQEAKGPLGLHMEGSTHTHSPKQRECAVAPGTHCQEPIASMGVT